MKKCYKCKETKALDEFHNNSTRKDGKCGRCKSCDVIYTREYRATCVQFVPSMKINLMKELRTCNNCRLVKDVQEFHLRGVGRRAVCRICYGKQCQARQKMYLAGPKGDVQRYRQRWKRYGLNPEQYAALVERQNNRCAICGTDKPGGRSNTWHIDHDPTCCSGNKTCGKCVRALLCFLCNVGLGRFKNNPELLRQAADYIEFHEKKTNEPISATRA